MKRLAKTLLYLVASTLAMPAFGAHWRASVGAQGENMGRQAMAFLPNEMWIHAGDTITWTFDSNEIHTVTFLVSGQMRPPFPVGCPPGPPPGITPSGSSVDGAHCVNTGPQVAGQSYTVRFPVAGNFKLVCLVHSDMTGVVHVLPPGMPLPYDQAYYDRLANDMRHALLAGMDRSLNDPDAQQLFDMRDHEAGSPRGFRHRVIAGWGVIGATPGGHVNLAVMRFHHPVIYVRAGQTVEWDNADPTTPHTITFGAEPLDPTVPSGNVSTDADGALHAVMHSRSDNVSSGFIVAEPQERTGLAQTPPGTTRFRVTFTQPGLYPYVCALHEELGMHGEVIVTK
ncbi:cupredoxin domain-containing protein [Fulvimonas yonginensis]|uniref:Plastocyanin/azurin family copper-binding protein n=1 Tax=Fulvimonas yonginensis TaxID=1495200 RepID=A0ABU8JDK0_9GAMM